MPVAKSPLQDSMGPSAPRVPLASGAQVPTAASACSGVNAIPATASAAPNAALPAPKIPLVQTQPSSALRSETRRRNMDDPPNDPNTRAHAGALRSPHYAPMSRLLFSAVSPARGRESFNSEGLLILKIKSLAFNCVGNIGARPLFYGLFQSCHTKISARLSAIQSLFKCG